MTAYTFEDAMANIDNGMSKADAFAPFMAVADAAAPAPRVEGNLNYKNIGYHNDAEGRSLSRGERMVFDSFGGF
jgi:hypothetical protein